jgi:uncharacterized membrane protein YbaN (DUF454 family)
MKKTKKTKTPTPSGLAAKIAACTIVVACLVIGVVGLVLPVIPGLLFLVIAAIILARHFPWLDACLRRHRGLGRQLDRSEAFFRLSTGARVKVAALLCLKLLLDTFALVSALASRLRRA